MMRMLSNVNDFFYTKNIIGQIVKNMHKDNYIIFNYLDKLFVQPVTVGEGATIPWEDNLSEIVFSSHTSLITENIILEHTGLSNKDI